MLESEKKVLFLTLQVLLANQKTLSHALCPLISVIGEREGQPKLMKLLEDMQITTDQAMEMVETVVKRL